MSRTGQVRKRAIRVDGVYGSPMVAKFVNHLMQRGKKSTAEKIFYSALATLAADKTEAFDFFRKAVENVMPRIEVRPRRIGGATYQVPTQVRRDRSESLGMKWLIAAARGRKGKPMAIKLAEEIKEASLGQGAAAKRRETAHRMAEANKAFAHFRW